MARESKRDDVRSVGRYLILDAIASGGMGSVHLAKQMGDAGFSRPVAIKFLHAHLRELPELVQMFLDEANLAARIHHPNVVTTVDVVSTEDDLFLVMDYVRGESIATIKRVCDERGERLPHPIAVRVAVDMLRGLHAAHVATDDRGEPLGIVHRDVSPQNVLVDIDGAGRLVDFGVAKAVIKLHTTREGQLRGKLSYMAPEQITDEETTLRVDVYAAAVVLWEMLTARKLFTATSDGAILAKVLEGAVFPPSHFVQSTPAVDAIVMRGLRREPASRFASALDMAEALEATGELASPGEVGAWVERLCGETIRRRDRALAQGSALDADGPRAIDAPGEATRTVTAEAAAPGDVSNTVTPKLARRRIATVAGAALLAVATAATFTFAPPRSLATAAEGSSVPLLPSSLATASPLVAGDVSAAAPSAGFLPSVAASAAAETPPIGSTFAAWAPPSGDFRSAKPPPTKRATAPRRSPPVANVPAPMSGLPLRPPTAPTPTTRKTPDCATPYFEDPSGIRRVKRECL